MRRGRKPNPNRKTSVELRAFGRLLKAARERTGRTQRDLAAELKVNLTTVGKYEAGLSPVPSDRARQLAQLLKAPELIEHTVSAETRPVNVPSATESSPGRSSDLISSRPALFDWWIERLKEIRGGPENVEPARLDEMRSELCERVTNVCRKEGASLGQTTDDVLIKGLGKELQTILEHRRLYLRPVTSAA